MKRIIAIILTILMLVCLASCENGSEESVFESSVQEEASETSQVSEESVPAKNTKKLVSKTVNKNETGKISQTNEYEYDSFGRNTVIKTTSEQGVIYNYIGYDKNGYEVEYITKDASGNIQSHHQYERYDNGYINVWRSLDKDGKIIAENIMDVEFDELGRMTNIYLNGELNQYYTYDENGNATERRVGSDAYNIYDKDNNKIEAVDGDYHMTATYKNGKPLEANATRGEDTYKTAYEYNDDFNVLSQTNYENGEITLKYSYFYDSDGDLIKQTMQNALGIEVSITEYEYALFEIEESEG